MPVTSLKILQYELLSSGTWFCTLKVFNLLGNRDEEASCRLAHNGFFGKFVLGNKDSLSHRPVLKSAIFLFVRQVRDLP